MKLLKAKKIAPRFGRLPLAAAILLMSPALMAQQNKGIEEVVVTAQKRAENLQDVPISIQTLGNESISELGIQNFQDYAKMLPSVSMTPSLGAGSSFTLVYMRGIATAGDGQASTSQPSVGMYLDEQPITTIQGNLDIHMYDMARVEALSGPQGTLYGASSQAGTIRLITNKPELGAFSAGYSVEGNMVDGDDTGYVAEGFVNLPINEKMAVRLVGWKRSDAGYIDNVLGSRTFPGVGSTTADDITVTNEATAEDNYNTMDTVGARASLRIDLNDNWTVTPQAMYQKSEGRGSWGEDLSSFVSGRNQVTHFQDEFTDDEWTQLGLTIEGSIGNFDVSYAASYLDREVDASFDYSDYSYWYDTAYTSGFYSDLHFANPVPGATYADRAAANMFVPDPFNSSDVGARVMGGARYENDDGYKKTSHELRISSPQENRLRGLVGLFYQNQTHDFQQRWKVDGLADVMEMNQDNPHPRNNDTVYMSSLDREDSDEAIFGSLSYDITDDLELTVGARFFKPEVTVKGFFGFGMGFNQAGWSGNGEIKCAVQTDYKDKPCLNVDKGIKESENVSRVNLTWQISDDHMAYGTWSEGYRPGGINRSPSAGNYRSDFLTNWELGWKTQWMDNTLQFNGAVFKEEWDDFQISFAGANAITQVANGPSAEVLGLEGQLLWVPTDNWRISSSFTFIDSELLSDYANYNADGSVKKILAPAGTALPVTAEFKGNLVARYSFQLGGYDSHLQGALSYEGERGSDMDQSDNAIRGDVPANTFLDLSAGIATGNYSLDLFIKNATDEDAPLYLTGQCAAGTCGAQNYGVRARPRTVGLRFSKHF